MIKKKEKTKQSKKQIPLKIGEHLVKAGAVNDKDVDGALEEQQETGDRLGKILQSRGKISAYRFYQEYARFKDREFINLEDIQCESSLFIADKKDEYIKFSFVPFSQKDGIVSIATTDENAGLTEYLVAEYGENGFKVYITSPYDILWTLQNHFADFDTEIARNLLHTKSPEISSKELVFDFKEKLLLGLSAALLGSLLLQREFFIWFLVTINLFYFLTMISKMLFLIVGVRAKKVLNKINSSSAMVEEADLPVYSILVPMYKEKKKTIEKLLKALKNLNYPKSKLDIKLICEIDDFETVEAIKSLKPESYFQIIRVPYSEPRTKPKACNYALNYCVGEYVTIYDAEDIPDPDQLRKTTAIFINGDKEVACIQARLNYFNRNENLLTGLFSIEYSSWFDYMLFGLKKMGLPIPLGGTSNHFKLSTLKALYAWDPYNVTEDADLGVRLAFAGLDTVILDSLTEEEATINVSSWMAQRARWIKGYIQTYFVHMKNPVQTYKKLGMKKFWGFTFFVGAPFIVFLSVPFVFAINFINYIFGDALPDGLFYVLLINLYMAIVLHFVISGFIIFKNGWYDNILPAICFPFYWLLHYVASFRALYELVKKPHHWNKTEHGLSTYSNTI